MHEPETAHEESQHTTPASRVSLLRILLTLVAMLLLLVAGAVVWLINDTERVRALTEQLVSNLTERTLRIEGDFDYHLGTVTTISATDIAWQNAAWSSQPTMLTIADATVSIDLLSLYKKPIVITHARVSGARLDFEWGPDGKSNWLLEALRSKDKNKPKNPLPLLLDTADLQDIELHFRHPDLTDDLLIRVDRASQQQDEEYNLVARIQAVFDGRDMQLEGKIGPFPELIIAGAVGFDFSVTGPNASLALNGRLSDLASLQDPNFELQFVAPEIETIFDIFNMREITRGAANLHGYLHTVDGAAEGSLAGQVGEFDVDAALTAASLYPLRHFSLKLDSEGPDAQAAGSVIGVDNLPREPYTLSLNAHETAAGLAVDKAVFETAGASLDGTALIRSYPELADIDLDINVEAENIARFSDLLPGASVPAISMSLQAKSSSDVTTEADDVEATLRLGRMKAGISGSLVEAPNFAGSEFSYQASLPDTSRLQEIFGLPLRQAVPLDLSGDAKVTSEGLVLANTQGEIGQHTFTVKSDIPLHQSDTQLKLVGKVAGPNAAEAALLFVDKSNVPPLPYAFNGTVSIAGSQFSFSPVKGNIGDNQISVTGDVILTGSKPYATLNLYAEGADLNQLVQALDIEEVPGGDYSLSSLLQVSPEGFKLTDFNFQAETGQVQGTIDSGWPDEQINLQFDLSGSSDRSSNLLPYIPNYQPADVSVEFTARGSLQPNFIDIDNLDMRLGSSNIELGGRLTLKPEVAAENIAIKASGRKLTDLGKFDGWQFEPVPFSASATVSGTGNHIVMDNMDIIAGPSDLRGNIELYLGEVATINAVLHSNRIDARTPESKLDRQAPAEAAPTAERPDNRVIPDFNLPLELLEELNGKLVLNMDQFISKRFNLTNIQLIGSLQDELLEIPVFKADTSKGSIDGKITITPDPRGRHLETRISGTGVVIPLKELDDYLREAHPGSKVDLHLMAVGDNTRELAATLNGFVWFQGGERKILNSRLNLLFGDFLTEVFVAMNPFAQQEEYELLKCDRLMFELTNGVLETAPAALLLTDKVSILAAGSVDLRTEKIDFSLETTPRKGIGLNTGDIVNAFSKIEGTMAKPRLRLDPTGTLVEGGAAVATMGLSIVAKSLYKRWLGPRKPCEKITKEARKIRQERDPNDVPAD